MVFGNREVTASPVYDESGNPIASIVGSDGVRRLEVSTSTNPADFTCQNLSETTSPAVIESANVGPYLVGGQSLTIAIDGAAPSVVAFAVRAQSDGSSVSGPNTATATGNNEKMRVSVDGGLSTEIKIGKNQPDGLTIAARIQLKIRADVPGGAAVTCVFTAPGYTITSGTVGVGSSIVVTSHPDPNKDVAAILGLGVANGGTETVGQIANTYTTQEVIDIFNGQLTSTTSALTIASQIKTTTAALGPSASILVTAGGANTAIGFPTTLAVGGSGAGSSAMNVDGSTTTRPFSVVPHVSRVLVVSRLILRMRDASITLGSFAGVAALTNGLLVEIKSGNEPLFIFDTFRSNAELIGRSIRADIIVGGVGEDDMIFAQFEFAEGVKIRPGTLDEMKVTVRDNLTGVTEFVGFVEGHLI